MPQNTKPASASLTALLVIFFFTSAVIGWVLFINQLQSGTVATQTLSEETIEEEYVEVERIFLAEAIKLPEPNLEGEMSLEESIQSRRSRRAFSDESLSLEELGQILWAAQGVTDGETGHRAAPSAHALYPFELYVSIRNVESVPAGLYLYQSANHSVQALQLSEELLLEDQQGSVINAPATLIYSAIYSRAEESFDPEAAVKVTLQESGHIAQNVYLQAETLGLATVVVGGFDPVATAEELQLPANEDIVYLQAFGPRSE